AFLLLRMLKTAHKQPNQVSSAQNTGKHQRQVLHPENVSGKIRGSNQPGMIKNNAVPNRSPQTGSAENAGQNNVLQGGVFHGKNLLCDIFVSLRDKYITI
ncbi:MAG: hypothetical protein WAT15_00235, partial [Gemmiger qucibialis]